MKLTKRMPMMIGVNFENSCYHLHNLYACVFSFFFYFSHFPHIILLRFFCCCCYCPLALLNMRLLQIVAALLECALFLLCYAFVGDSYTLRMCVMFTGRVRNITKICHSTFFRTNREFFCFLLLVFLFIFFFCCRRKKNAHTINIIDVCSLHCDIVSHGSVSKFGRSSIVVTVFQFNVFSLLFFFFFFIRLFLF